MPVLPTIATLWIGDRLTWLEQLCLKSFVDAGHPTLLYAYNPIMNAPAGVTLRDAAEVFAGDTIIKHTRTGSPAIHADLWRLHLMQQTDYIWVDADVLCVKPFDFNNDFVFGLENRRAICNAVLRLPARSAALQALMQFIADPYTIAPWLGADQQATLRVAAENGAPVHFADQAWGLTGPAALSYFLKQHGEWDHALPQTVFYPVPFKQRNKVFLGRVNLRERFLSDDTHAVHLWARRLKWRLQEEENNRPRRGSFLDQALARHGILPQDAPIPARAPSAAGMDADDS